MHEITGLNVLQSINQYCNHQKACSANRLVPQSWHFNHPTSGCDSTSHRPRDGDWRHSLPMTPLIRKLCRQPIEYRQAVDDDVTEWCWQRTRVSFGRLTPEGALTTAAAAAERKMQPCSIDLAMMNAVCLSAVHSHHWPHNYLARQAESRPAISARPSPSAARLRTWIAGRSGSSAVGQTLLTTSLTTGWPAVHRDFARRWPDSHRSLVQQQQQQRRRLLIVTIQ